MGMLFYHSTFLLPDNGRFRNATDLDDGNESRKDGHVCSSVPIRAGMTVGCLYLVYDDFSPAKPPDKAVPAMQAVLRRTLRTLTRIRKPLPVLVFIAMAAVAKFFFSRAPSIPSLLEISLEDIKIGLEQGTFTATDLVNAYIQRAKEVDHVYRSVLEFNPDALSIARDLDEKARASGGKGPLHGVPILLKDNIVTLDSMEATAGSYALKGAKPGHELQ
ncbi:uncharacterized protein E0L32_006679 [Thyridium curvatum]|uniref:Amidase domain-containing protein n=1 Tax=Thyridium curvatum TaxID=1093900 RepID=A0A507B610_9PEZI|nr:uncharacterized protein E0L32_006679 [Thyridium curvatum]TPX12799.1 hypothetical protein E0L32_006679 [Thyridium curvatum]